MAHAMKSGSQVPELSALETHLNGLLASMETRGLLHALCTLLIDIGVVSEERLLAEAYRQSFAAARRMYPCDWNTSLLCVFESRDVASKIASGFSDRNECAGHLRNSSVIRDAAAKSFDLGMEGGRLNVSRRLLRPSVHHTDLNANRTGVAEGCRIGCDQRAALRLWWSIREQPRIRELGLC